MKKTISGLLALFLLLSLCAGCGSKTDPAPDQTGAPDQTNNNEPSSDQDSPAREGQIYTNLLGIDPGETVLESGGTTIPAELYCYWLTSACGGLEYNLNMYKAYYGMYGELLNEDGTAKWEEELDGTPLGQIAKEQAVSNAMSYIVLENEAAARDISLTDEDKASLEKDKTAYIEQLGGQEAYENSLWEMGVSEESFDRISATGYLYQHLLELARDPDSDLYQAPADTDAYVDHILLMTVDSESREPLSEEEAAAKKEKAEELLAQLQAADPAELEALFTQLANENGEDEGRTPETGYLMNADTNFVQPFKDAAFALKPGELSGIVESDYGYHIILRKELTEDQLATIAEQKLAGYLDGQLETALAAAVRSDKLESIDAGEFYRSYQEAITALHPELNTDAGTEGGEEAGDGTTGGTEATTPSDEPAE